MTVLRRLRACLVVCCLAALVGAGSGLAAAERPSPQELWELYPLDQQPSGRTQPDGQPPPAGGGAGETTPPPSKDGAGAANPPPSSGGAGARTTQTESPASGPTVEATRPVADDDPPLSFAIILGGVVAALLMLGAAAIPERAVPRFGGQLVDHRFEMAVAGTLTLIAVTVLYVAGVSS